VNRFEDCITSYPKFVRRIVDRVIVGIFVAVISTSVDALVVKPPVVVELASVMRLIAGTATDELTPPDSINGGVGESVNPYR
jgi:hypothetical protein